MRKLIIYIATAAACAAAAVSCSGQDNMLNGVPLKVELFEDEVTELSISFTLAYENADAAAFVCLSAAADIPEAPWIMENGTRAETEVATYIIEELYPATAYVVYAAASKGNDYSEVVFLPLTTLAGEVPAPSVALAKGRATESTLSFTLTTSYSSEAAFAVLGPDDGIPDAAAILEGPNRIPAGSSEITLKRLDPEREYVVAAASSRGDALSEVEMLNMATSAATAGGTLYRSLPGRWNARLAVLDRFGSAETTEIEWTVDIVTGINETTEDLYNSAKRLCCIGFLGERVYYPDELLLYPYWQENPQDANWDWGPKWFLEFADNGAVTVPPSVPSYFAGDHAWTMSYTTDKLDFFGGIAHSGIGFYDKPIAVAVSEDMNTVTIDPWTALDPVTGEELIAYPSQCNLQSSGEIGYYNLPQPSGGTVTSIGAGPLVLTRAGGSPAPHRGLRGVPAAVSGPAPAKSFSMKAVTVDTRIRRSR